MDNDEIKELVEDEFGYIGLDNSAKQLVEMFIKDIMKHEKVSIDDITEVATGLKGEQGKILKAGDYVLLDTDFVFDENDLPDGKKIKDILIKLHYENFEMRYQREKKKNKNVSR